MNVRVPQIRGIAWLAKELLEPQEEVNVLNQILSTESHATQFNLLVTDFFF